MRVNTATIGAVMLGSSVMAQSAPAEIQPDHSDALMTSQVWELGRKMPVTRSTLCPTSATTAEERIAQRYCLCGEESSFLQDAVACTECKVQNGLAADVERDHWQKYFKAFDDEYCKAKEVPLEYNAVRAKLDAAMPVPKGGKNFNQHQKVVDPRIYYGSNVPKKQGAAKAAPVVDNSNKDASVPPMVDPVAGQVTVPVFVAVEELPTENKTEPIKPTTARFQNGTATMTPTSQPSTFLTVTSGSTTTTILPSSSVVPAPGTVPGPVEEHIIVIAGKRCVVYIVWVIIDCTPKLDAAGNFAIDYNTVGVDKKEPVMLENSKQFDMVKDSIPDAGKDNKLAEDVKKHVGTASPVVPAPVNAPGKNKDLPPVKVSTGSQPTEEEEACEDVSDLPQKQQGHNGGSEIVAPVVPGSQPSTANPGQIVPTKPNKNSGNVDSPPNQGSVTVPGQSGQDSDSNLPTKPIKNSGGVDSHPNQGPVHTPSKSNPDSGSSVPSNPLTNTCECECPSTIATAFSSSSSSQDPEICNKKVETETACKKLSGRQMWECLCSQGEYFEKTHFFKEAVQCERRKSNLRESEFEAQILFEVNYRYCQKQSFGNDFGAAYSSVSDEWRASRAPAVLV